MKNTDKNEPVKNVDAYLKELPADVKEEGYDLLNNSLRKIPSVAVVRY